jgi:DNA-binding IscR family transcriptional regulator
VTCVDSCDGRPCERLDECVTHRLWQKLSTTLEEELDAVTLADLVTEARKLAKP